MTHLEVVNGCSTTLVQVVNGCGIVLLQVLKGCSTASLKALEGRDDVCQGRRFWPSGGSSGVRRRFFSGRSCPQAPSGPRRCRPATVPRPGQASSGSSRGCSAGEVAAACAAIRLLLSLRAWTGRTPAGGATAAAPPAATAALLTSCQKRRGAMAGWPEAAHRTVRGIFLTHCFCSCIIRNPREPRRRARRKRSGGRRRWRQLDGQDGLDRTFPRCCRRLRSLFYLGPLYISRKKKRLESPASENVGGNDNFFQLPASAGREPPLENIQLQAQRCKNFCLPVFSCACPENFLTSLPVAGPMHVQAPCVCTCTYTATEQCMLHVITPCTRMQHACSQCPCLYAQQA